MVDVGHARNTRSAASSSGIDIAATKTGWVLANTRTMGNVAQIHTDTGGCGHTRNVHPPLGR